MTNHFDQLARTWDQDPKKVERSRATAEQCKQVPLQSNKSLLDIGGGTGLLSLFLRDSFDSITLADTSSEMLKVAQEKITEAGIANIRTFAVKNDISEIPGTYSAIITLMTLHHITDLDGFIRAAANLLDEQGTLMIADLVKDDGSFHSHVTDFSGHDGFDTEALSKKLQAAGFQVSRVTSYYKIMKKNHAGEQRPYPLFFLAAKKL